MMSRIRRARLDGDQGFTLIELLVVMIIIGILAAIAIPLYLSQRAKGYEATAKSDDQEIATDIASALTDGFPSSAVTITKDNGSSSLTSSLNVTVLGSNVLTSKVSGYDKVSGTIATTGAWCVVVGNKNGGNAYAISNVSGLTAGATCSGSAITTTGGPYTYTTM